MLKNLFSSTLRIDLLSLFLMNPDRDYYLRELTRIMHRAPDPVRRELGNLLAIDLVTKQINGKQHHYQVNKQHPLYDELSSIFIKTVGLKQVIYQELSPLREQIPYAFVYGSMARGDFPAASDVDLMLIGDISSRKMSRISIEMGTKLGREVNYAILTLEEFVERVAKKDHFITSLLSEKKLFILGEPDEFERLVSK